MGTLTAWVSESEVDVTAVFNGYVADKEWPHFLWSVRVQLPGNPNAFALPYRQGVAHCKKSRTSWGRGGVMVNGNHVIPTAPDAASVMSSLQSDAQAGDETFEDFCSNFGYDEDSRKAEKIWRTCQDTRVQLRKVLGTHYETFMQAENDV